MRTIAPATLLLGSIAAASAARAETLVPGGTLGDAHWTAAAGPYRLTGNVTVGDGATLTVDPGVRIELDYGLVVRGTLIAVGTTAAPILFTGVTEEPGSWGGLELEGTDEQPSVGSRLEHVTIAFGGYNGANLMLTHARATVLDCELRDGSGDGLRAYSGATADVRRTRLTRNVGYAVRFDDPTDPPTLEALTAQGNGHDRVAIGGGRMSTRTFPAVLPYEWLGDVLVEPGETLTFAPGVLLLLHYSWTSRGTIVAVGTAEAPIRFLYAGPERGEWGGLALEGTEEAPNTGSIFEHVVLEDGGYEGANLMLTHAHATVRHAAIRRSAGAGLRGYAGGTADVSDTRLEDNAEYALRFDDARVAPKLAAIVAGGNGEDRIALGGGTTTGVRTLDAVLPYHLLGTLVVPPDGALHLGPGVELRMAYGLQVQGTLLALGAPERPIRLVGETEEPGAWGGLELAGTAERPSEGSVLEHVLIAHGGYEGGNLTLFHARAKLSDVVLRGSSTDGLRGYTGGLAELERVELLDNAGYAVRFDDPFEPLVLGGLSARGNGQDSIALGGHDLVGVHVFGTDLPYELLGGVRVPRGSTIVFEAGAVARFSYGFEVGGTIRALGTAARPVHLGALDLEGHWGGLYVFGASDARNEGSLLEHTILDRGGDDGANLWLRDARIHVVNSVVSNSASDGVRADRAGGTLIEGTAFVNNGRTGSYAVRNDTLDEPIWAIHDWWGSSAGPRTEDECNPGGAGALVSAGVVYSPFLTEASEAIAPVLPLAELDLSLTPLAWFVPADGLSKAHFVLTARDRLGRPLAGRRLTLESSRGDVTGGGLTDLEGQVFAYVVSSEPGDAVVTAAVESAGACEPYRSATSTITFTADDANPLMPSAEAPYLADIEATPARLVQGQSATLRARLTNLNDVPITIDAEFGYAQLGIGLAFGPIGTITGRNIPAGGETTLEVSFVPQISGHYCVELTYHASASTGGLRPAGRGSAGGGQTNLDVEPGSMRNDQQEDAIEKARHVLHGAHSVSAAVNGIELLEHAAPSPFWLPEIVAMQIPTWILDRGREISDAMQGKESPGGGGGGEGGLSPAGPAYDELPRVEVVELPLVGTADGLSAARAAATNAWLRHAVDAVANFAAMAEADARARAAAEDGDLEWSSQQAAAYRFFQARAGAEFSALADAGDELLAVLRAEGVSSIPISAEAWAGWQDELRAQGFPATSLAAAALLGFDATGIEARRTALLGLDPDELAGDRMVAFAELSAVFRLLGEALSLPPSIMVSGQITGALAPPTGNLARVYERRTELTVGNPTSVAAVVELRVRRVDLPADWSVEVTPARLELPAGGSAPVIVILRPGSAVAQGTRPRFAVEGTIGGALIGGVVFDTLIPTYVAIDAACVGGGASAEGQACACDMDCGLGLACGGEPRACHRACDLAAPSCPGGQTCAATGGPGGVCLAEAAAVDEGCGCRAGRGGGGWLALALAALGLVLRATVAAVRERSPSRGAARP